MRTWTIGAIGGLGCLVALGCGSDEVGNGGTTSESRAVRALIDSMRFDGGIAYLQPIPPTTEGTVNLLGDAFDLLEPGVAGLLPFTEDNPLAGDDPSSAVLIGFGDADRHIGIPVDKSVGEPGELSFAYELDEDVCADLCNRRYTIALHAAIKLESGGIGELLESEIVLDCRASGSEEMCAPDEHSQTPPTVRDMDASTNEEPDASNEDSGSDAGDASEPPSSNLIGEAGGTVSLPDGAEAEIPPMAVAEPTPIALKVASETPALPSDVEGAGDAYVFEPHGTVFDTPVTLRLPFTGSATDCRVLYLDDEDDETWEEAEGTPVIEDGVAELEVTHFSIYQVVRPVAVSVDPCAEDNGGCDTSPMASCEPDGSTRTCACPSGYDGDGVGTDGCTDLLECATDNGGCDGTHECIEQVGEAPVCDLDECATNNGNCGDATYTTCENQLDGVAPVCTDIDECATDNGGCGAVGFATCSDNIGAAQDCVDIEECTTNNGGCGPVAFIACMENVGAAPTCMDIEECDTNNGGCGAPGYTDCVENVGAAPTCMDIDECATNNGSCGDPLLTLCTNRSNNPVICTRLWAQIDATDGPMCARRRDGTIDCAGYDYTGGNATVVAAAPTDVIDISTGQGNACTIHADHHMTCYGYTGGTAIPIQTAAANDDPVQNFVDVEIGGYRLCALRDTGTLACYGALDGNGTTSVLDFDVTGTHVCVIHIDGTLACFGTDNNGCVSGPNSQPGNPSDPNNRYISVTTGDSGTCALRENGTFICWGNAAAAHVMGANADDEFDYVQVSMGQAGVCGVHSDHTVTCWGTTSGVTEINALGATNIAEASVANYGICLLRTDGSFHCYGGNTYGFQGLNTIGAVP